MKNIYILSILLSVRYVFGACPDGTLQSLNNPQLCYQFITDSVVFTEAEMECQNKDGHLAGVTDGFTNTFLAQNANKTFTSGPDFWVGGEDLDQKGKWVWTDGKPFVFQNWAPNEPDLLPGYQCISITKDRSFWYTTDCFDEKPYICELPALVLPTSPTTTLPTLPTVVTVTTTMPSGDDTTTPAAPIVTTTTEEVVETTTTLGPPIYTCDGGWSQFNASHSCFKVFPKNVFDDAENACKSFGGHLASIHSSDELTFAESLLDNSYHWFGLCTNDTGNTWAWTDGTTIDDFAAVNLGHWCSTGPQRVADTCVVLNPTDNCFTNVHKTLNTYGLCEKPANVSYGPL